MKITVFKKVRSSKDGRKFDSYITRLSKKDGSDVSMSVKFSESCKPPVDFPIILEVEKKDANLSKRRYTDMSTGDVKEGLTLWLKKYNVSRETYVDHSLDEYED